ncbi:transposase InsO family protein [Bradyrhizobium sp. USDA 223]
MSLSERRACWIVGADRKMIRYRSSRPPDAVLRGRLRDLANERRRFGYRRLFVLLRREGEPSGINRIYRLYREEGLTVRKRRARRKAVGTRRGEAERALVAGLRPRPVRQWPTLPHPQHRRRRHQGMPGRHSGDVDLGAVRGPRIDGNRPATRQVRNNRVRPWHRIHLQRHARLVQGRSHRLALHCAGKADAERLRREFHV